MRIVNWNVKWATPKSQRSPIILKRIFDQKPEIVCITEGYINFLPDNGHVVTSEPDYGYSIVEGRRKVILWSKKPWTGVDALGNQTLPPGRFVRGTTETSIGILSVIGVCIPWDRAHVGSGKRNRKLWEDHLNYLTGLEEIIVKEDRSIIITGDFNQKIPRTRVPIRVYEKLTEIICSRFCILTAGEIAGVQRQTIDHIVHSHDLRGSGVFGLSNTSESVRELSDHFGIVANLERVRVLANNSL